MPIGIALGAGGITYLTDFSNHKIRAVSSDRTVVTLAGGGAGGALRRGAAGGRGSPSGARTASAESPSRERTAAKREAAAAGGQTSAKVRHRSARDRKKHAGPLGPLLPRCHRSVKHKQN